MVIPEIFRPYRYKHYSAILTDNYANSREVYANATLEHRHTIKRDVTIVNKIFAVVDIPFIML